jgi:single-stranded-DNA-specific exonuclease
MTAPNPHWQLKPQTVPPHWLVQLVQERVPAGEGHFAAQLLWQRGLHDAATALAFLDASHYQPTSPWAFGLEMEQAITRLQQAQERQETVFIWGDFDADGMTATAVLWEGLGQFFTQGKTLQFTIPSRLTESHGLSKDGIDTIAARGAALIITCDTGSSAHDEIDYAQQLGIDVIVTDHHTLPSKRPAAVAVVNPRTLPSEHPLATLSGVAVAYKLVEALYERYPDIPTASLENLLDLVTIGLVADLVQLVGDGRYLAQRGLQRLKQQLDQPTRPGVAALLKLCKKTGDRPADIAFGLGPRINALSRIHGNACDGVELLTSRDPLRATQLAESAELTNLYRKEVQQRVTREAEAQLAQMDLETTAVIVLSNPQWPIGILGLVASHLAQTYGRPAILLSQSDTSSRTSTGPNLLRGSARSVQGVDLYDLLAAQAPLLHRYGGHPLAAGLSLPPENLPLFTAAINQSFRQQLGRQLPPTLDLDLEVRVADLAVHQGADLFQELSLLEPYGMGNPTPRLLLRNCWLEQRRSSAYQALGSRKSHYPRTQFLLRDASTTAQFSGLWWGHYADELPPGCCDVVVELDYGLFYKQPKYHARLVAVRPAQTVDIAAHLPREQWLLDWRAQRPTSQPAVLKLSHCPETWADLEDWAQQAKEAQRALALAYPAIETISAEQCWQQLAGIVKYAARTGHSLNLTHLQERLALSEHSLAIGFMALKALGFVVNRQANSDHLTCKFTELDLSTPTPEAMQAVQCFLNVVAEEQFQRDYFQRAPTPELQKTLEQRLPEVGSAVETEPHE